MNHRSSRTDITTLRESQDACTARIHKRACDYDDFDLIKTAYSFSRKNMLTEPYANTSDCPQNSASRTKN